MAKGNMILGYLRGSIGDITFYRSMGQQMSRARNRQPANPRTVKQVLQRAKWACASKFFTQVGADFFKYAYQDKGTKESYFNAFMRKNVSLGGLLGAAASKVYDWPAVGLWQISDGKLPGLFAPFPQEVINGVAFDVYYTGDTPTQTIGGVTRALVSNNSSVWREGDIITLLAYVVRPYAGLPTVDTTTVAYKAYTGVWQIVLNSSNNEELPQLAVPELGMNWNVSLLDTLQFNCTDSTKYNNSRVLYGLIHSRITSKGLEVSPSIMVCPQSAEWPLLFTQSNGAYEQEIITDWQAADTAILAGGLVNQTGVSSLPFMTCSCYFLGTQSGSVILDGTTKAVPNNQTITWNLGESDTSTNRIAIYFTGESNPGYNLLNIDHTKISFINLDSAEYDEQRSEQTQVVSIFYYDINNISSKPTEPIFVYYDEILIMTINFV